MAHNWLWVPFRRSLTSTAETPEALIRENRVFKNVDFRVSQIVREIANVFNISIDSWHQNLIEKLECILLQNSPCISDKIRKTTAFQFAGNFGIVQMGTKTS